MVDSSRRYLYLLRITRFETDINERRTDIFDVAVWRVIGGIDVNRSAIAAAMSNGGRNWRACPRRSEG